MNKKILCLLSSLIALSCPSKFSYAELTQSQSRLFKIIQQRRDSKGQPTNHLACSVNLQQNDSINQPLRSKSLVAKKSFGHDSEAITTASSAKRPSFLPPGKLEKLTPWQPDHAVLFQTRRRNRQFFGGALSTWTGKLVTLNALAFGLQMFSPSFTRWGAKVSQQIWRNKEWHRLITPVFLHGGLSHLAVNSASLLNVGPQVESLFGKKRFIATYLAAGIAGNVASAIMSPNPSVGASGAIFGLIGAYYAFLNTNQVSRNTRRNSNSRIIIQFLSPCFQAFFGESGVQGRRAMQQTLVVNAIYGLATPSVDNWAHLGGAIGGAAMALTFGPRLYLYDDYETRRRIIVDRPRLTIPKEFQDIPRKFSSKLRRLRRKMQTDRYTSTLPTRNRKKNNHHRT